MNKRDDEAIQSGVAHVDEMEDLISGYSSTTRSSDELLTTPGSFGDLTSELVLSNLKLSMFVRDDLVTVRVGNALNGSQFYECSYGSIEEANDAMLNSGILSAEGIPNRRAVAGIEIKLGAITEAQLIEAGLKRQDISTL
jgi:hypothetical protein